MTRNEYLMHAFHAIGDELDERSGAAFVGNLFERGLLSEREAFLIKSAVSQASLERVPAEHKNNVRADIMRHIIMTLMS